MTQPTPIDARFPEPLQCLFEPKRYKVLFGGRGAGRSWGAARALLLIGAKKRIRVLCARELQKSIEDSVHRVLSDQIHALGLDQFYTILKHSIVGKNGTSFAFEGIKNNTNKIRSFEGIDYCWVEEAIKVSKNSWSILIPTIRKSGSEIWLTFNPELEEDNTYKRFVKDRDLRLVKTGESGWTRWESSQSIVVKMTWSDNPWFAETELPDELDKCKRDDYDEYLNVWEGYCVQHLEGAVYAKELRRCQEEGRICTVPYDREVPVDCFFDIGRADNTAIWFTQRVAMQWRLLKYYEESGEDWPHFLKYLQGCEFVYGTLFLPHDAKAKRLGSRKTIEELTRQAGYRVSIVPKLSITDGINAARIVLKNCYFDEDECADGLHALRHYRFRVIDGHLSNEPLHDSASDGADSFRYFAVSAKTPRQATSAAGRGLGRVVNRLLEKAPGMGWMG